MNIINATILRNNLADAINTVEGKKDYMLIAKRGEITSALVNIDLLEDLLALANKKYRESIKKARDEYKRKDIFTHDQVFGEV